MTLGITILSILYILVCAFLVFIILMQKGDSGGLGGLGGGMGGGDSFLGATADRTMKRLTLWVSIIFVVFSIFLGIVESPTGSAVEDSEASEGTADPLAVQPASDEGED